MTNQNEAQNCPKHENDVDSETDIVITEVNELENVKRPVGRPRKHFDPNYKYPRTNLYYHCDVCNKTCEYYHQKKHFKTKYHLKRLKEQGINEEVDQVVEDPEPESTPTEIEQDENESFKKLITIFKLFLVDQSNNIEEFKNLLNSFDYRFENDKIIIERQINNDSQKMA